MVSAAVYKKLRVILINRFIHICLCLSLPLVVLSQQKDDLDEQWEKRSRGYRYVRDKNYDGPEDWYGSSPSSMKTDDNSVAPVNGSSGTSSNRIEGNRQEAERDGGGDLPVDPKTKDAEPIELPDINPPDLPDVDPPDLPEIDPPTISENIWRTLLVLIVTALLIFLIYMYLKNRKPSDKKIDNAEIDLDWNPKVISKSALELRLEEALNNSNYRACVRIYFTFILKELIRKNWIFWSKEKTNHHYLLEMGGKPNAHLFAEAVRIYDLVWYGEYEITKAVYDQIQPVLDTYYRSLADKP